MEGRKAVWNSETLQWESLPTPIVFNPVPDSEATCAPGEIRKGKIPTGSRNQHSLDLKTSIFFSLKDSLSIYPILGMRIVPHIQKVKIQRHISHPELSN